MSPCAIAFLYVRLNHNTDNTVHNWQNWLYCVMDDVKHYQLNSSSLSYIDVGNPDHQASERSRSFFRMRFSTSSENLSVTFWICMHSNHRLSSKALRLYTRRQPIDWVHCDRAERACLAGNSIGNSMISRVYTTCFSRRLRSSSLGSCLMRLMPSFRAFRIAIRAASPSALTIFRISFRVSSVILQLHLTLDRHETNFKNTELRTDSL